MAHLGRYAPFNSHTKPAWLTAPHVIQITASVSSNLAVASSDTSQLGTPISSSVSSNLAVASSDTSQLGTPISSSVSSNLSVGATGPVHLFRASGQGLFVFTGANSATDITFFPSGALVIPFNANLTSGVAIPGGPTLHGLSGAFIRAVSTNQDVYRSIQVWTSSGTFVADITESVLGGSVTVDETAEIRRTVTLDLKATPDLIPKKPGDLLHPATANELHIFRGVQYPWGTVEAAQLGVFRISKPDITDSNSSLAFSLSGYDRSQVVARQMWRANLPGAPWGSPYTIFPGSNMSGVVQQALIFLLEGIYPNLNFDGFNIDSFPFPLTTFGATQGSSDPMSDLQTFVAASAYELFFDITGNPVLRLIRDPVQQAPVDTVHFVEGDNCVVTSAQRTFDETQAYNGVILFCNGTGTAGPFVQQVWDANPASPTYFLGPWGRVGYPMTTTIIPANLDSLPEAQNRAYLMAQKQYQLVIGALDSLTIECVPNPALQEGDVLTVTRERLNLSANYVISQMEIPLDTVTPMSITFRPQVTTT